MGTFKLDFELIVLEIAEAKATLSSLKAGDQLVFRDLLLHGKVQDAKGEIPLTEISINAKRDNEKVGLDDGAVKPSPGGDADSHAEAGNMLANVDEAVDSDDRPVSDSRPEEEPVATGPAVTGPAATDGSSGAAIAAPSRSDPSWRGAIGVETTGGILLGSVPPKAADKLRPILVSLFRRAAAAVTAAPPPTASEQSGQPYRLTVRSIKRGKPATDDVEPEGMNDLKVLLRAEKANKASEIAPGSSGEWEAIFRPTQHTARSVQGVDQSETSHVILNAPLS